MSSPTSETLIEITFPDRSVSRYPLGRVKELLQAEKIGRGWPARIAGTGEWIDLDSLVSSEDARIRPADRPEVSTQAAPSHAISHAVGKVSPSPALASFPSFGADETVIASIGQHALVGFVKGEGIASTQVVLTARRIYVRGRSFTRTVSEQLRMIGDLTSICSLSLHNYSNWPKLVFGVLLFLTSVAAGTSGGGMTEQIVGGVTFFVGTWLIISFFITRRRYLRINMGGEPYDVSMEGVDDEQVLSFIDTSMAYLSHGVSADSTTAP
ncbi:hypothetical protein OKA05_01410 [Luteolibacter arcticus]|uniref:GYF domain-containing protein n=1 Tax=Luteolibacter arcticus TaxID=1581411 RepID=A0ABT3GDU7_9BACT|nr:hypothetical protein [Luteolibacter arcticus]MCW1921189.1 hypothetical protein [Luteolibacter arcticus]